MCDCLCTYTHAQAPTFPVGVRVSELLESNSLVRFVF